MNIEESDPLSAARGMFVGFAISIVFWTTMYILTLGA
jgi:hypothetical protein